MLTVKWTLVGVVVGYAGLLALMYVAQRSLMYFPEKVRTPPAAAGLPEAQEVFLQTADGEKVIAWHVPPRAAKPLVLYFHGNAAPPPLPPAPPPPPPRPSPRAPPPSSPR